jgi:hypothetical protein
MPSSLHQGRGEVRISGRHLGNRMASGVTGHGNRLPVQRI